ncbi:hypothetical protein C4D60_Mb11t02340 [Musa balbisiana]|uniref:Cyclin-dependent kinase inhibitor domain-containing protein n=1 Tax=Musa balbisiana TaxID=52838 RepID=A0A4S8J151_MUSBA|nr:hypothetical protein C4D60_Mb11t02340 [Musa balbisiana]
MGKYMRKAKVSGEVAVMEVSHQSSVGVRTRARTLAAAAAGAARRTPPAPTSNSGAAGSRSPSRPLRPASRARTPPSPSLTLAPRQTLDIARTSLAPIGDRIRDRWSPSRPGGVRRRWKRRRRRMRRSRLGRIFSRLIRGTENMINNNTHLDRKEKPKPIRLRCARETTPCSLIRNPEAIRTPSSTNRPSNSTTANRRMQIVHQNIPSAHEMDEFFAGAEQLQQRIFIERYNFDPVNDCPLPGRYEWVKVDF